MSHNMPFSVEDRRKRGYFTIDNILLDEYGERLGPYGIAVYAALARFANQEQECWPSHATVAKRTGMSSRQVPREINKLAALGIIEVVPRYDPVTKEHLSNLYVLLEVRGIDTQSIGGIDSQSIPMDRVTYRTKPKKKESPAKKKKEESKRNYKPDKYADIILG